MEGVLQNYCVMVRRVEGGGWKVVVVLTFQLGSS